MSVKFANAVWTLIYFSIILQEQCLLSWPHFSNTVILFWERLPRHRERQPRNLKMQQAAIVTAQSLAVLTVTALLIFETTLWSLSSILATRVWQRRSVIKFMPSEGSQLCLENFPLQETANVGICSKYSFQSVVWPYSPVPLFLFLYSMGHTV